MIPRLVPAMVAMVDQETSDIVEMLEKYPSYATFLSAGFGARETGRLVAVDTLARLAESASETPQVQLAVLTARLHAWLSVTT